MSPCWSASCRRYPASSSSERSASLLAREARHHRRAGRPNHPGACPRRHGRGGSAVPRRCWRFRPAPVGHPNRTLNSRSHCRQDSRLLYRREWCTASTDAVASGRSTTVGRSQCGQRTSSIIPSAPSSAEPIGVAVDRCRLRSTSAPRTYRGVVPRRESRRRPTGRLRRPTRAPRVVGGQSPSAEGPNSSTGSTE